MAQNVNDVEILQYPKEAVDQIALPAVVTDEWNTDDFVYYDQTSKTVKAYKPADMTTGVTAQTLLIGTSASGKKKGENRTLVNLKTLALVGASDGTNVNVGSEAVVVYDSTTGKYSVVEKVAWGINNAGAVIATTAEFVTFSQPARESVPLGDGTQVAYKAVVRIDGHARLKGLN